MGINLRRLLVCFVVGFLGTSLGKAGSVVYESKRVLGVSVKVIRVNLADPRVSVRPVLPNGRLGGGSSFHRLVNGSSAAAIINGGYFHPGTFSVASDLVVNGRFIAAGKLRSAFTITKDNKVAIRVRARNPRGAYRGYQTALSNGPYILQRSRVAVYPRAEGFRDPAIWRSAARSALGVSSDRKLFFVSTRQAISLYQLAKLMRALGAKDAITLDGGSSVGLSWQRQVLIRPNRNIAYGLGVFVRK